MNNDSKPVEICNECGRSIAWGSGLFIDRVIDFDDNEYMIFSE